MVDHCIVHVEFSSHNPGKSTEFYSDLFGWKHLAMPEFDYYSWDNGNGTGGGYNKITEEPVPGGFVVKQGDVIAYVATDSVDASLARAEELGARIVTPKTEVPGQGWYGHFVDPDGNRVGLWEGAPQEATA
jgi:predicted enzyme related to lactoylglutathione lyase